MEDMIKDLRTRSNLWNSVSMSRHLVHDRRRLSNPFFCHHAGVEVVSCELRDCTSSHCIYALVPLAGDFIKHQVENWSMYYASCYRDCSFDETSSSLSFDRRDRFHGMPGSTS